MVETLSKREPADSSIAAGWEGAWSSGQVPSRCTPSPHALSRVSVHRSHPRVTLPVLPRCVPAMAQRRTH